MRSKALNASAYLSSVYPAAQSALSQLDANQLERCFDMLDYYYSLSADAVSSLHPRLPIAVPLLPVLPRVPMGAFYSAHGRAPLDRGHFNAVMWADYSRHMFPVTWLPNPLSAWHAAHFHSSFGARLGPQPSWTSPLALVRYVLHPHGIVPHIPSSEDVPSRVQLRKAGIGSPVADAVPGSIRGNSRVARLHQLRDGDVVEIEQWGGLLGAEECPPICGLWANVWRGTGITLRVRNPFVSLNKATAIVDLLAKLGERNATALSTITEAIGARAKVQALRAQYPQDSPAACLGAYMLSMVPRAGNIQRDPSFAALAGTWEALARRSTPQALVDHLLQLLAGAHQVSVTEGDVLSPAGRFALHWAFGISGKSIDSPFWKGARTGPDGLIATLACVLDHRTIIFAASSNDNGLLHQELVDFELPAPLGWPSLPSDGRSTNDVHWCLKYPFAFVSNDKLDGASAQAARRRQMLDFWRGSAKFGLPTETTGSLQQPVIPCELHFGQAGGAGGLASCRGPKLRVPAPNGMKACWAWCNGTLSRVLESTSLGHVRGWSHGLE